MPVGRALAPIFVVVIVIMSACAGTRAALPLELVESAPVETTLDHADLRDAYVVWPEMIGRARRSLDLEEFYVSSRAGARMAPVLRAIEAAADRGVAVRLIADSVFARKMPDSLARLGAHAGIQVRVFDATAILGGVQHAKFFVVDGREAFLGSQNFDWLSLEHIQELGVRIHDAPGLVRALDDVFETDWALAGGAPPSTRVRHEVRFSPGVTLVASPKGFLPDENLWDLPRLVALIDGARSHVRVQALTYGTEGGFDTLDRALRRAAGRGVSVEVMVSDWSKRKGTLESLKSLAAVPGVVVKTVTIPEHSSGFLPFARVVHAKYLVVDGAHGWVGTSNWEGEYFTRWRNVGVIVDDAGFAGRLDAFFADLWHSGYVTRIEPGGDYPPPRIE